MVSIALYMAVVSYVRSYVTKHSEPGDNHWKIVHMECSTPIFVLSLTSLVPGQWSSSAGDGVMLIVLVKTAVDD